MPFLNFIEQVDSFSMSPLKSSSAAKKIYHCYRQKLPQAFTFSHWSKQIPSCRILESNQRHWSFSVDSNWNKSDLGYFYPAGRAWSCRLWYDNNGLQRQASENMSASSHAKHSVHAGKATGSNKQINMCFWLDGVSYLWRTAALRFLYLSYSADAQHIVESFI